MFGVRSLHVLLWNERLLAAAHLRCIEMWNRSLTWLEESLKMKSMWFYLACVQARTAHAVRIAISRSQHAPVFVFPLQCLLCFRSTIMLHSWRCQKWRVITDRYLMGEIYRDRLSALWLNILLFERWFYSKRNRHMRLVRNSIDFFYRVNRSLHLLIQFFFLFQFLDDEIDCNPIDTRNWYLCKDIAINTVRRFTSATWGSRIDCNSIFTAGTIAAKITISAGRFVVWLRWWRAPNAIVECQN